MGEVCVCIASFGSKEGSEKWCKAWYAGKKNLFDAFVVIVVVALKLALPWDESER